MKRRSASQAGSAPLSHDNGHITLAVAMLMQQGWLLYRQTTPSSAGKDTNSNNTTTTTVNTHKWQEVYAMLCARTLYILLRPPSMPSIMIEAGSDSAIRVCSIDLWPVPLVATPLPQAVIRVHLRLHHRL
jgi:hypothetical protein